MKMYTNAVCLFVSLLTWRKIICKYFSSPSREPCVALRISLAGIERARSFNSQKGSSVCQLGRVFIYNERVRYTSARWTSRRAGAGGKRRVGPSRDEDRSGDASEGASQREGPLGTTLALGRVIMRFVSREPPGSTRMRRLVATLQRAPSYSSRRCFRDDPAMTLPFSLSLALLAAHPRSQSSVLRALFQKRRAEEHAVSLSFTFLLDSCLCRAVPAL